jgi:hypothetical protein
MPAPRLLAPSVLYRWRAMTQAALRCKAQREPRKDEPKRRHKAEIERMRAASRRSRRRSWSKKEI